mgnify:CR=1 FL=1
MPNGIRKADDYGSTIISVVSSAQDTTTQHFTLSKVLDWIKEGRGRFSSKITEIRQAVHERDLDRSSELKRQLPAALFSGTFQSRRKSDLSEHSGIICIDFDKIEDVRGHIDQMRYDPHIIASFVSPSGNGIKTLIAIPKDDEAHLEAFLSASKYMKAVYGLDADESGKDVCRMCFLSYDPEMHSCLDAVELPIEPPVQSDVPVSTGSAVGDRIGDRYQAAPDIRDRTATILRSLGWQIGRGSGDVTYCTRPNKERGVSGTMRGDGSFYCFTDNASPLQPSTNYSAFALYTTAKHSGDFKSAAQELADEFGDTEPSISGRDYFNKSVPTEETKNADIVSSIPMWTMGNEVPPNLSKLAMQRYPVLIDGLLHRGTKMVLGGGSKSYKTWTLLNLAACVAEGSSWFGRDCVETGKKVIFLNFEVPHEFFLMRVKSVCDAMGIPIPSNLGIWSLRGVCNDLRVLLQCLEERLDQDDLALLCIDPIYKALGDRDENSAGDMGLLMNEVEALVERTGAAVAFGAHYSKGNQAEKDPLDRISGSGVFARDPDTIMGLTAHEEPDCYTVHAALRNFPHLDPFVVKWDFPLFQIQQDLNPNDLKKQGQKSSKSEVIELLRGNQSGLTKTEWRDLIVNNLEIGRSRAYSMISHLESLGRVHSIRDRYFIKGE